jgi:two-component system sensor histidine kinase UhpB
MDELEHANARLTELSRQILEVQEAERREIARELHDEIGQTLTAIKINVQGVQRLIRDEAGRKRLDEVVELAGQTLDQVRGMSLNLRPSQLDDLGLEAAVRWNAGRQVAAAGMVLHFQSALGNGRLPGTVETACFRVSQEALTNVVRHAAASNVWVTLAVEDNKVELMVRDDGCGFDPVAKRQRAHGGASFGLLGMEERAKLTGGNLQIEAPAEGGTTVRAWFPVGTAQGDKQ